MTWMRSLTDMRLALATRLGVEEDDEEYWARCPTTTRAPRSTRSTTGSATSRRPSSSRVHLTRAYDVRALTGTAGAVHLTYPGRC